MLSQRVHLSQRIVDIAQHHVTHAVYRYIKDYPVRHVIVGPFNGTAHTRAEGVSKQEMARTLHP